MALAEEDVEEDEDDERLGMTKEEEEDAEEDMVESDEEDTDVNKNLIKK